MLFQIWRDFWQNPRQARYMVPLVVINAGGSVYGYYWYHQQLASTPIYYWLFVADSPFSTTLFAVALVARLRSLRESWFSVLAFVCCLKYGLWAVIIISHFWLTKEMITPLEIMIWLSHWGMVLEGWAYLRSMNFRRPAVLVSVFWLAINDAMDYVLGLHPYLFSAGQEPVAAVSAMGLTFIIFFILWGKQGFGKPVS